MSSFTDTNGSRKPRSDDEEARQRIVAELRRLSALGQDEPIPVDFAASLGMSRTNMNHHLKKLEADGELAVRDATRPVPCKRIYLLDPGGTT